MINNFNVLRRNFEKKTYDVIKITPKNYGKSKFSKSRHMIHHSKGFRPEIKYFKVLRYNFEKITPVTSL